MSRLKLRESIAIEAARLVLRGKEADYGSARKRAARWLSKRKVAPADLPSDAEIHSKVYALAGFFSDEQQQAALSAMRDAALEIMDALAGFEPRVRGCAVDGPVLIGSEINIDIRADSLDDVIHALSQANHRVRLVAAGEVNGCENANGCGARLTLSHRFPCELTVIGPLSGDGALAAECLATAEPAIDALRLRELIEQSRRSEQALTHEISDAPDGDEYHPDTFPVLRVLLSRLGDVQLDPQRHPEGDALYHSLQVYELGLAERPYDEEFLLACLLHDVGLGIDRRDSVAAGLQVLAGLLTERTCFLIEHRPAAREFLRSGKMPRSLRRSEHFDDLVLLAQCDLNGRLAGAEVSSLGEALDYIAGLSTAWDDA